jgi:putative SOS response-associated peptidase YedK
MPVMLTQNKERDWLWADSEEKRKQLFDTISDEDLGFTPVSTRVNDVRNDDETLLKPWTFPEQQSLF